MSLELQHPVVLLNGLIFPQKWGNISYYEKVLASFPGQLPLLPSLPAWGTQKERMDQLKSFLQARPEKEFHLIGHSQGGVDARMLLEDPDFRKRILTLTSINSPFRGTPIASFIPKLKHQWSHLKYLMENPLKEQKWVPHFSVVSSIKEDAFSHLPLFRFTEPRLRPIIGENDGFLALSSMRMGEEILYTATDHLCAVGWPHHLGHRMFAAPAPQFFFEKIFSKLSTWEKKR
ncbi:MAG: lipase family alpha/beta hydrolase [Bacteriovoracaceae bacterium]